MEVSLYTKTAGFSEAQAKGVHVVVIDVLRASSTIVQACENGVERIIPVVEVQDATRLLSTLERQKTLLGGEREGLMIEGFDLGNSPLEYASKIVRGKTLILCTSNGTVAITASAPAKEIVIGCFLNLGHVVSHLLSARPKRIALLCAGNLGQFALEDFVCGGHMVRRLEESSRARLVLNDGAVAARALAASMPDAGEVVQDSSHGRRLQELGFEADLEFCSRIDKYRTVPIVVDGRISGSTSTRR
jgi:2-phosphosulfolactate phosphatase